MDIVKTVCPSCGAPIVVTGLTDVLKCSYCSTTLAVRHSQSEDTLSLTKEIRQAIQEAGAQASSSIRARPQDTKAELRRRQLDQQLSAAQMELAEIQADIRSLKDDEQDNYVRSQLKEMGRQESKLLVKIDFVQSELDAL